MTVIVQPPKDSNGNPQPMVYDQDTGKVIVDHDGYVLNGGQRLVNVPSKAAYVSTPKTQTSGIKEAHDYAISVGIPNPGGGANHIFIPEIHILRGNYTIYDGFIVSGNGNIIENYVFKGETSMAPWIMCNNTGFAITLDASSFNNSNIEVSNMQPQYVSNADGFMTATLDSNGYPNLSGCPIAMYNMNISNGGWNKYPIYLSGTTITLYNWQNYGNQAWFSGTSISFFGGVTGGEYIYGTPMLQLVGISGGESYASPGGYFTLNNVITVSVFGGDMQYGRSISFNLLSNVNQISVIGFYTIVQNNFQEPFLINNTGGAITVDYLYIRGLQTTLPTSLISNSTGSTTNIIYPDIKYCNYTNLPIASPTTPSVPSSGTAQQNTNSYPVDVYIYGGDVTEIQITRNGTAYTVLSVSTAIAMSGQVYKLNPGDSISVTYSTAPSWEWLSD